MPRVEVPAFTGGLVTRISEEDLKPNQLSEASNITISKTIGAVETRRGLEIWDSLSFLSDMNMFWQNVFATSGLVIRNGNDFYVGDTIVYENMDDAETIFEIFDNWLVMCNGTRNLKYKDTGMALRWNSGFCFSWEDNYVISSMKSSVFIMRISEDTNYYCCFTWEVEIADGNTPTSTNLILYTSSCETGVGEIYSDDEDIIVLDCEETSGKDFLSKSLKSLVFSPEFSFIDNNTKLLLLMEGGDGTTTFVDNSSSKHVITPVGNAQIDTDQYKHGSSSLLVDDDGDYLSIPDSDDFYFGADPFTIDFFVRFNALDGTVLFFDHYNTTTYRIYMSYTHSATIVQVNWKNDTDHLIWNITWAPVVDTWYHIALIRGWGESANSWAFCVNGSMVDTETDAVVSPNIASIFTIGGGVVGDVYSLDGWIDIFRITKGFARWTENFNPPGDVQHSSAQYKYGAQSLTPITSDGRLVSAGTPSFALTTLDYTFSFFLRMDANDTDYGFFEQRTTNDGFSFRYDPSGSGSLIFEQYIGGVTYSVSYTITPAIDTWYHIAIIRGWGGDTDSIVICVDGVPGTPTTAYDLSSVVQDETFYICGTSLNGFAGFIDEFRLTAEAFWTSAFTPPIAAYSPPSSTVANRDLNFPVQLGITPPSSEVTVADSAVGGNPDGDYTYKVTYLNDRGSESNPSDASSNVVVATNKVTVSDIPISSDPQVTQRRLYRTTNGGASYLLVTTIDNNYDETYTDNIADTSLGAAAPSDNDVPPAFSCIAEHQGLLYGVEEAEENVLWYCNQFDELDHWNDTNYETVGSGDVVTHGLISFGNLLVALQRAYLWIFNTGDDTLERAFTNHGVHNAHSFLNTGDGILYIDVNGMFSYTTIAYDTMRSVSLHQLIGDIFDSESNNANRLDPDYISNVRVGGIGDDIFISYTRQGQTTNDRTIHYNKEAKRVETLMDEGFVAFTHNVVNKDLYGCSTDGYIYKLLKGSDDNGTAISWSFSTKDFANEFGSIVALKQAGWMFLDCNPNGETLTIQVYYDDILVKTFTSDEASRYILRKKLPVPTQWNRVRFALSGSGKQYVYGLAFDGELTQRRRDSEIQR